jgi:hypothetical protein
MLDNRTLATVRTYAQLISVLRARSDELEIIPILTLSDPWLSSRGARWT